MPRAGADDDFSRNFRFAVNTQRIHRVSLSVISFPPIEHEVGGKKDEWDRFGEFGEQARDVDVDTVCERRIGLARLRR